MKILVITSLVLLSVSLLAACGSKTAEQQIASINGYIAPEGHLTKTHLYIHWPAEFTKPRRNDPGGKEIVPALTLKIPVEYLGQNLINFANGKKIFLHDKLGVPMDEIPAEIDYRSRINEALSIHDRQITMIYLRFQPGAKPNMQMIPFEDDPPDLADKKFKNFLSSYAVHIKRNYYSQTEPRFECIVTSCFAKFGLKERLVDIGGEGEALDSPQQASFNQKNKIVTQALPNGLPRWYLKVDPTQALLNSFILPEDSPEVKKYFQ